MKSNFIKYSLTFLLLIVTNSCSEDINEELLIFESGITNDIFDLVNEYRSNNGLQKLTRNATADKLATEHTEYMIGNDKISHDNFSSRSENLKDKENAKSISENVAYGYTTAEKVVAAWLNSLEHRENIEGDFTHTGVAAIKNSEDTYYYTQIFYE